MNKKDFLNKLREKIKILNNDEVEDIINEYSEFDLYRIIRDYGEEKFAKNIAKHIVAAR